MRGQHVISGRKLKYGQDTYYSTSQKYKGLLERDAHLKKVDRPSFEFCGVMEDKLGQGCLFTRNDAFHALSSAYGLSYDQIVDLIKDAREKDYLEATRIRE